MPSEIRLTPTSYIVLGLIEFAGESTPYDLKQMVGEGLGQVWSIHHAQLYSEPERLAKAGFLHERREPGGRRRRYYKITKAGSEALSAWLVEPTTELTKARVPSMLKLVLGSDPKQLGAAQLPARQARLDEYEERLANLDPSAPRILRLLTELGIEQQQEMVRYWTKLAGGERPRQSPGTAKSNQISLTPNSYFVLHLVKSLGEATPYQLKRVAAVWDFWTMPHAQLYSEPERLAKAGFLRERREPGGRRRRYYKITRVGAKALRKWLAEPEFSADELRDLAVVKLLFGADPKRLAEVQLPIHRERLAEYEILLESLGGDESSGPRAALEAGIAHERIFAGFWQRLIEDEG